MRRSRFWFGLEFGNMEIEVEFSELVLSRSKFTRELIR